MMTSYPAESEYRVEKVKTEAVVVLSSGTSTAGSFFLAGSSATHAGPERVADVLNAESGFFPFEVPGPTGPQTILFNRPHVVMVKLGRSAEPQRDPGYDVATRRTVSVLLSNGLRLAGEVRVYRPFGRDRLSDYARSAEAFRYVETAEGTLIINTAHIVEIFETFTS